MNFGPEESAQELTAKSQKLRAKSYLLFSRSNRMRKAAILNLLIIVLVVAGLAQKPSVSNARLQEVSAAGGLKTAFDSIAQKQESPAWIGYRIPVLPKERTMCCFDSVDQAQTAK